MKRITSPVIAYITTSYTRINIGALGAWVLVSLPTYYLNIWTLTPPWVDSFFSGMIAASVVWYVFILIRQRQEKIRERLLVIAELNHHIRNALQAVTFQMTLTDDITTSTIVMNAVQRIDQTMVDLIPIVECQEVHRCEMTMSNSA